MSYEIDGDQVVNAARQYAGTPYDKLSDAHSGARDATLNPLAFGLIGSAVVGGSYEQSRKHWETELKGGVDKWAATIVGLNTVAKNHHAAESASIINSPDGLSSTAGADPGSGSSTGAQGAMLAAGWILAVENLAIATILGVASTMAPVALVATIGWAAFSPMDDDLNRASGLWESVHRNLQAFPDSLGTGTGILNSAWPQGQPSRTAFDNFLYTFNQEVDDAIDAAAANKSALDSLNSDLSSTQHLFLIEAGAALVAIIAAQACTAIPVVGVAFEAMVQAIGGGLTAATAGTLAVVVNTMYACFKALDTISGHASFAGAAPASDDHPPHFTDIKINWDGA